MDLPSLRVADREFWQGFSEPVGIGDIWGVQAGDVVIPSWPHHVAGFLKSQESRQVVRMVSCAKAPILSPEIAAQHVEEVLGQLADLPAGPCTGDNN
jgi:hypothetical protein